MGTETAGKTTFVVWTETAKMARALDQMTTEDRRFVEETISYLGAEPLPTESVNVGREAGVLSMRIERMSEQDRNVLKGLVTRILAKNKARSHG